jgi:hypothetical protein
VKFISAGVAEGFFKSKSLAAWNSAQHPTVLPDDVLVPTPPILEVASVNCGATFVGGVPLVAIVVCPPAGPSRNSYYS